MRQLVVWLGPQKTRLLVTLVVAVGLGSLGLQLAFSGEDWVLSAQLALIWLFVGGLALLLSARLEGRARQRLWLMLGPGLVLLALGVLLPPLALFFAGGGLGWMITAQVVLRNRVQMEYQAAIRHLRRNEYDDAVAAMAPLIRAEPDNVHHRRFRAEIYRLAGDLHKAVTDYERVVKQAPDSHVGYTGLAEVHAQQGDFARARGYAQQAFEHGPNQWMTAYNLGMIADRLVLADDAVMALEQALSTGLPHSRYRLLAHLWLARNYHRQGDAAAAQRHLALLRKQSRGLREWQVVFQSEQAAPLRRLLAEDVALAERMFAADAPLAALDE